MVLRSATEHDLPAMRKLMHSTLHAPAWSDAGLLAFLGAPAASAGYRRAAWVACRVAATGVPGALAGFAAASVLRAEEWAECELEFIVTAPAFRGQGVGRSLLGAVLDWARAMGAMIVRLEVRASNTAALRLYRSAGFRAAGRRAGYYRDPDEDALLLELAITGSGPEEADPD